MNNRSAMSLLRRPEATMRTISSSRAVTTLAILYGHAKIEHHDIRPMLAHRGEGRLTIHAAGHHFDILLGGKQLLQSIQDEGVVVGQHYLNGHGVLRAWRAAGGCRGAPPHRSN